MDPLKIYVPCLVSVGCNPILIIAWWWALLFRHNTCVWQTDGRTDGRWTPQHIPRCAYASRGKNKNQVVLFGAVLQAPLRPIIGSTTVGQESSQIDQTSTAATRPSARGCPRIPPCRESITDLPGKPERCRPTGSARSRLERRDWCRRRRTMLPQCHGLLHHINPSHTHSLRPLQLLKPSRSHHV